MRLHRPAPPRPRRSRTNRARGPGGCRRGAGGSRSRRSSRRSAPRDRRRRRCRGAGRRGRACPAARTPRTREGAPRRRPVAVGSSCRSASVSRAISGLLASTACHASSVAARPRSGQPAARSSSSESSAATCACPHSGATASTAPAARSPSEAPRKRLHEHPTGPVVRPGQHGHQVSDPVGEATHDGRLGDEVVAARLEPQRAAVGGDLEHGRDAPDPVRAEGAGPPTTGRGQLVVHPRLDAVVPAGTEPVGPSGRGLTVVLLERRADRRPQRFGEVVDPPPVGAHRRSVAQREDVQPIRPAVGHVLRQHHDRRHVHPVSGQRGGVRRGIRCVVVLKVLHEARQLSVGGDQDGVAADERDVVRAMSAGHAENDDGRGRRSACDFSERPGRTRDIPRPRTAGSLHGIGGEEAGAYARRPDGDQLAGVGAPRRQGCARRAAQAQGLRRAAQDHVGGLPRAGRAG